MAIKITTPRGTLYTVNLANGQVRCGLRWNKKFGADMTASFSKAQMYIDNEVLKFCSKRVPFDTGMLQKSGVLGTVVGSGTVTYIAPYAAHQYYNTAKTRPYDANRGAMWFERGKATEKARIMQGARKIAGGT